MNQDTTQAALSVRSLSRSYGAVKALSDVSFSVLPGEFVALLGPNGAGKTTLFNVLTGLLAPDQGSVSVNGISLKDRPVQALARLGIVFQAPTLDLGLSARRNLRFHARLHGLDKRVADERIEAGLARVALAEQGNKPVGALSGGNRRKVELARALLTEPELLLMDEATVGLDPASRRSLLEDVHMLRETRQLGVLWATHLVDEAEQAEKVIVLDSGTITAHGTPADLCKRTSASSLADAFLALTEANNKPGDNAREALGTR